jgi:hypothetical protein
VNRGGNPLSDRFGRRPTRGLRPWLLLPKLACVAIFIGSVAAACFVWFTSGWSALDPADPRRLWTVNLIGSVMRFLAVPALTLVAIGT